MGSARARGPEVNCRLSKMELKDQGAMTVDNRDQQMGWVHRKMLLLRLCVLYPL